jgi:hypothetical protein
MLFGVTKMRPLLQSGAKRETGVLVESALSKAEGVPKLSNARPALITRGGKQQR